MKEELIEKLRKNAKRKHLILGTAVFSIIMLFMLFSDHGIYKRASLEYDKYQLEEQIQAHKQEIEILKNNNNLRI